MGAGIGFVTFDDIKSKKIDNNDNSGAEKHHKILYYSTWYNESLDEIILTKESNSHKEAESEFGKGTVGLNYLYGKCIYLGSFREEVIDLKSALKE